MKTKFFLLILLAFFSIKMQAQCSAAFTYTLGANGLINLTATSNIPSGTSIYWEFGNGVIISGGNSVSYTYPYAGNYTVCLHLTGVCSTDVCQVIPVSSGNTPCQASFSSTTISSTSVNLVSTGTNISTMQYTWLESGNVIGTGSTLLYNNSSGTYTISLATYDPVSNCTDTINQTVIVGTGSNPNCNANFTYTLGANGLINLTATSNIPSGTSIYWEFGNGVIISGGNSVSYTYPYAGNYTVCLHLTGVCSTDVCQVIPISSGTNTPCQASFSSTTISSTSVNLVSTGTNTSTMQYTWLESGNVIGTGSSLLYSNSSGTYTIYLATYDPVSNCTDTVSQSVIVGPSCNASPLQNNNIPLLLI